MVLNEILEISVSTAASAGALRSAFPSLAPNSAFSGLTPYDRAFAGLMDRRMDRRLNVDWFRSLIFVCWWSSRDAATYSLYRR
jgi:hypothetical protein